MSESASFLNAVRLPCWAAGVTLAAATWLAGSALAQTVVPATGLAANRLTPESSSVLPSGTQTGSAESGVVQAGCSTCGGGLPAPNPCNGCGECCYPGRPPCCPCDAHTCIGQYFCDFYHCICCPDPCYEPHWVAGANAAFFVDSARPVNQMTVRYDAGFDMRVPDRNEFFWARADGRGKGPRRAETALDYNRLSLISEAATAAFSIAVELPYLSIDPQVNDHAANFTDMNIATKSLLLDCELLQFAFQFRTFIPIGDFQRGIGNAHVSLEPSLLAALKLAPDTYLQAQLSEWIPLGGDKNYQGAILHYHASLNQVLCRPIPDFQIIGTLEFNGWSFQTGEFTDPALGGTLRKSGDDAFLSAGPGLRFVLCDKLDAGVAAAFQLSGIPWPSTLLRTEFRYRF